MHACALQAQPLMAEATVELSWVALTKEKCRTTLVELQNGWKH